MKQLWKVLGKVLGKGLKRALVKNLEKGFRIALNKLQSCCSFALCRSAQKASTLTISRVLEPSAATKGAKGKRAVTIKIAQILPCKPSQKQVSGIGIGTSSAPQNLYCAIQKKGDTRDIEDKEQTGESDQLLDALLPAVQEYIYCQMSEIHSAQQKNSRFFFQKGIFSFPKSARLLKGAHFRSASTSSVFILKGPHLEVRCARKAFENERGRYVLPAQFFSSENSLSLYSSSFLKSCPLHSSFVYNSKLEPRLGISASKKTGKAPIRNHYKRSIREAFRKHRSLFYGFDLHVLVRADHRRIKGNSNKKSPGPTKIASQKDIEKELLLLVIELWRYCGRLRSEIQ